MKVYDDIVRKTAEDVYKLKYGEDALARLQLRAGAATEQLKKLEMLQKERTRLEELKKVDEDRLRIQERQRETIRHIVEDIETQGMDRWKRMFYDLVRAGTPRGILEQLMAPLQGLSAMEGKKDMGPTPGWSPLESWTLRGINPLSATADYPSQTARNTAEHNRLLRELLRILNGKEIINIKHAELN